MGYPNLPTDGTQEHVPTTAEVQPVWLTYREAEIYASLSRTTLWRIASNGELQVARIGRAVRINRPSLEAYLKRATEE